jgi:hypothetical protein
MQVFTGHAETTLLALMLKDNVPVNAPLDYINAQKLMEVEEMSKAMAEIYAQVAEKDTRDRKASIQKHNDKTHVRSRNTARAVCPSCRSSGMARAASRV